MKEQLHLLAFDVGNSAVRTILAHFSDGRIRIEEVLNEPNTGFEEGGYIYWDMDEAFRAMKRGLSKAAQKCPHIDSVGICTWGVDFRLIDENGGFVSNALSYRNAIGEEEIGKLPEKTREEFFYETGILSDKINSVYMLKGIGSRFPEILKRGARLLMVPDVFVYMFTGVVMNEPSELTTSQMVDVRTMEVSRKLCDYAGVSPSLFPRTGEHGKAVGNIKKDVLAEAGIDYDIPLVCVPSHDTASAVMGIPSPEENYLFVSSGTWALIGADTPSPCVTEQAMRSNLTNEGGAFGRTTLLRNSAGMFILQRLKADYQEETGQKTGWNEFTALAGQWKEDPVIFDVNDRRFFNPRNMAFEIRRVLHPDAAEACSWPEILASTYASLAESYAESLRKVMACTKETYSRIYVVGGGSRNAFINQRCADLLDMPVCACDMECSSVGNAAVQITYFHPEYSPADLRKIVSASLEVKMYQPSGRNAG